MSSNSFSKLADASSRKFQLGEGNKLEMTKSIAQRDIIRNLIRQNLSDVSIAESHLQALTSNPETIHIRGSRLVPLTMPNVDSLDADESPSVQMMKYHMDASQNFKRYEKAKALPEFKVGFFTQTLVGFQNIDGTERYFGRDKRFNGLQAGLSFPLWFYPHSAQVKASDFAARRSQSEYQQTKLNWWASLQEVYQQAIKYKTSLDYYESSGIPMANLIRKQAVISYQQGEIGFSEFLLSVNQALDIQESYLTAILNYNQAIIKIQFLAGNKS